jgi:putative transposase
MTAAFLGSKPWEVAVWTPATRAKHNRSGLRDETDLTDAEWALMAE